MLKVTILGFPKASPSSVVGPLDVFAQSGIFWNRLTGLDTNKYFDVELVTPDGGPLNCMNGVVMQPKRPMQEVERTDLIVMSSIADFFHIRQTQSEALEWVKGHYANGAMLASVCTGAFFLAETGLLDGKTATTHWGFAPLFAKRYPNILLRQDKFITDEGNLFCSGGVSSGVDLAFYLVEKLIGYQEAMQCAKALAHDYVRDTQRPYGSLLAPANHNDGQIVFAQKHIEDNFDKHLAVEELAQATGMARRTFERRFKQATGQTPLSYLQRARVEAAKRLLESTNHSFEEITCKVGYEDCGSFRRIFMKVAGILPREYRQKFKPSAPA